MKNLSICLLAVFGLLQSCAPAKLLRAPGTYQPGFTMTIQQEVQSQTFMEIMGESQVQYSTNTTEYYYQVKETLPDGQVKWDMVITRFIMESEDDGGETSRYDSADPDKDTSDLKTSMMENLRGHVMQMTTDQEGQILAFTGADKLFDKMLAEAPSGEELGALSASIKKTFGDTAMLETVKNIWGSYPPTRLRVGAKWKESRMTQGIINSKTDNAYKLKSRNNQEAVIRVKTTLMPAPGKASELDMGFAKITYELFGEGAGSIVLSQPDGMLKHSSSTINMKGTMHMEGEMIPKMEIPITSKTTITTTRIK